MVVAQYLLTFREVLEAALLTAIIMAYLVQTGRVSLKRYAWYGLYGAVGLSLALGAGIWVLYGSLSEVIKVLFEGLAALLAVVVLTSMIYWMATRARRIKTEIQRRVEVAVTHGAVFGLFALTFVLVFREGLETVLFLTPFLVQDVSGTLLGAVLGLAAGTLLAYGIFSFGLRLDLRKFFYFTSVVLILLAGGLLGYGVHELMKYGELQGVDFGWWGQAAYALPFADGSLFHNKGLVGSIFAVLVGYDTDPEWARVIAHGAYLAVALPLVVLIYRRPEVWEMLVARVRNVLRGISVRRPEPGEE